MYIVSVEIYKEDSKVFPELCAANYRKIPAQNLGKYEPNAKGCWDKRMLKAVQIRESPIALYHGVCILRIEKSQVGTKSNFLRSKYNIMIITCYFSKIKDGMRSYG